MHKHEDGTVLLSTLLVLSLMSAVALALLTTVRTSIVRTAELSARSQIDLYSQGVRDFAQSQMDIITWVESAALNERLMSSEPIVLPFDNGSITMMVSDGSHCFRLSALSSAEGLASDTAQQRFDALMQSLGVDSGRAARVAAAAVDWVDADSQARPGGAEDGTYLSRQVADGGPHRTANVPMQSVTELRAINEMDEALFQLLLPYVCIGTAGAATRFNIDTAEERHAPVLSVILGGGPEADRIAFELINTRPSAGYGSEATLLSAPALQDYDNPAAQISDIVFEPDRIVAEVIIRFGLTEQTQLLSYEGLDSGRPTLSYRAWGWEELPSAIWARQATKNDQEEASQ